jgi:putative aminopeptidase FrvX
MSIINSAVENTEAELISLRNELIERTALLETTVKDKVKLNLSVDEIGLLFRSLKDAGIIEIDTVTGLARFIAQNFESKLMGNLSTNNLYNKITTPVGKSAPAVLAKLDEVANAVKKIREK